MKYLRCKQRILWLFIAILFIQLGCAHKPPIRHPSEQVRTKLGSIGVVSALFVPKVEFSTPAKGRLRGALTGAAQGAGSMAGSGAIYSDPYGLLLGLILAPVAGLIGGVAGGVLAEPAVKVEKEEARLRNVLTDLKIQETMRNHFLRVAREKTNSPFVVLEEQGPVTPDEEINYCSLSGNGIDTVLEISVLNFGLKGSMGINPPIEFFMNLRLKLIRTIDGEMVYVTTMRYEGKKLKFADWSANNAQSFREEFNLSYLNLSERIVDKLFFLSDVHLDSYEFCGLYLRNPDCKYSFWKKKPRCVEIDSLQPTLQWESFPNLEDKIADKMELISRIRNVSYDLKIWRVENELPVELVYTRQKLTDPTHKIDNPLEPLTTYFWTVRANFKLDGQNRVIKWSYSRLPYFPNKNISDPCISDPCISDYIPISNYCRFVTPQK